MTVSYCDSSKAPIGRALSGTCCCPLGVSLTGVVEELFVIDRGVRPSRECCACCACCTCCICCICCTCCMVEGWDKAKCCAGHMKGVVDDGGAKTAGSKGMAGIELVRDTGGGSALAAGDNVCGNGMVGEAFVRAVGKDVPPSGAVEACTLLLLIPEDAEEF